MCVCETRTEKELNGMKVMSISIRARIHALFECHHLVSSLL